MKNFNIQTAGALVAVILVIGIGIYLLTNGRPVAETPATTTEQATSTSQTTGEPNSQATVPTTRPAAPAGPAIIKPVLQYPAGCTSAVGTSTITGTACDGSAKVTITTPVDLPPAQSGKPYKAALATSGGPGEKVSYTWSVEQKEGAFPVPGLGFSTIYGNSISIVGTPADMYFNGVRATVPVTFTLKVTVTAGAQSAKKEFKLRVEPSTALY